MIYSKAMGSKVYFDDADSELSVMFFECIKDIVDTDMVQRLNEYKHHMDISRLQHCMNVSYYSFLMAKKMDADFRSAARGGLLHDLFFYDYKSSGYRRYHKYIHPRQALENAGTLCELNDVEKEIILNHMWPTCTEMPKNIETYIVSTVDKYCATFEAANFVLRKIGHVAKKVRTAER